MFNGKIHYQWPFSIAMLQLVYQRVICAAIWGTKWQNRGKHPINLDLNSPMKKLYKNATEIRVKYQQK